jgi:iron complex outermembrane receptor protein
MPLHRHPLAHAALIALAGLSAAPAAWAQAADGKLQTVTVTAERRVENIRDVPSSVSALAGESLEILNSGGQDIRQLAGRVPSLNIESSFGRAFPRFYIRGLGNTDFDLNASQPVSLVFDDVVQENPILKGFPIFDLERIEVLRGPQGTLFGRNSPAGVLKFESAKPGRKFEGYGSLTVGRYSALNAEGAVNVPMSPDSALRVSVQSQNRDDWVTNTYAAGPTKDLEGYHDNAARVQFGFGSGAAFNGLVNVHGRDLKGSARLFRANIISPKTNDLVPGFDPAKVSYDGVNDQDLTSTGGSVKMRWQLPGMALTSITGYEHVKVFSRGDIDGGFGAVFLPSSGPGFIPFDAESADGLPKHRQVTQEFRLESTTPGPLSWIGGLYYFDEQINIDSYNYSSIGGNTQNGYATQDQRNKAYAVFGSVNYVVSPAFRVRGGLRWTKDQKDFFADRLQAPPFSPTFIGRRTATTDASNTSFDLSGTFVITKDMNAYVRVATGFRAPSIQGRLLFGDTLSVAKSETVRSFEAGLKADLMDRRARVAATVFSYRIKDQQLTAVGGAANFNQLVNAKKTDGNGFELDFQLLATDQLLITASASLNKTKIKDPGLFIQPCGGGCTVLDPAGAQAGTVSIDGNPLPQAPKTVFNLGARYNFALPGGEGYVSTDWSYRSKINFFLYEAVEFTGKALTEGGVRAGYVFGGGKYEAAAFVRNVTNQIRVVGGIDFNNLTGFINEPRTYGVTFKATF